MDFLVFQPQILRKSQPAILNRYSHTSKSVFRLIFRRVNAGGYRDNFEA